MKVATKIDLHKKKVFIGTTVLIMRRESEFLTELLEKFIKEIIEWLDNGATERTINVIYNEHKDEWVKHSNHCNEKHGLTVSNPKAFEIFIRDNGYRNIITKPYPKAHKEKILEVIRIIRNDSKPLFALKMIGYKSLGILTRFHYFWNYSAKYNFIKMFGKKQIAK